MRARCDADKAVSMLPPIKEITVAAMLAASQSSVDAARAACASLNASALACGIVLLARLQVLDAQAAQRQGAGEVRVEIDRPRVNSMVTRRLSGNKLRKATSPRM